MTACAASRRGLCLTSWHLAAGDAKVEHSVQGAAEGRTTEQGSVIDARLGRGISPCAASSSRADQ
jgi:hypothetical protein